MISVRWLSDLRLNDVVETPTGRRALVKGIDHDAVVLQFMDDGDECMMLPHKLQLVTPAPRRPFPEKFFQHVAAA